MALVVEIKVIPGSGRNKWIIDKSGTLKCYLKNPPEKGLANKELIKLLAKALGLAQQDVEIIRGVTSRKKHIKIALDVNFDQLLEKLRIERQSKIWE